jgi:hypothetical protein
LDAGKEGLNRHREILEKELETVGIRLNQKKPDVTLSTRKTGGGVRFASTVPQTKLGPDPEKVVTQILREYKITSGDVLAREEITVDQLVDVIQGKKSRGSFSESNQIQLSRGNRLTAASVYRFRQP